MADYQPMPGQLFLNEKIAPQVQGDARPLAPGEYIQNPDGGWSSEVTVTVQHPQLNGGKPTVVPSMWVVGGKAVKVSEDQAAELAAKSGLQFPAHPSLEAAEKFATERESTWQTLTPQTAGKVAPLWTPPPKPQSQRFPVPTNVIAGGR